MKVLTISADGFEDSELTKPVEALREASIEVDIASVERGSMTGKHGTQAQADLSVEEVSDDDDSMLFLPGGKAPERLRELKPVQDLTRTFMERDKPIAAICHGPQILISAGLVAGRRIKNG